MQDKATTEKTYGYENTYNASKDDILDFNRENDSFLSESTLTLPVPNYTYDVYSINGQGIGGVFRPFSSQVAYVFGKYIKDKSDDLNFGVEIGTAAYIQRANEFKFSPSTSSTGLWEDGNRARNNFRKDFNNPLNNEAVYFKNIGEIKVDNEFQNLFTGKLGGDDPIRLEIEGFILDKKTVPNYYQILRSRAICGWRVCL